MDGAEMEGEKGCCINLLSRMIAMIQILDCVSSMHVQGILFLQYVDCEADCISSLQRLHNANAPLIKAPRLVKCNSLLDKMDDDLVTMVKADVSRLSLIKEDLYVVKYLFSTIKTMKLFMASALQETVRILELDPIVKALDDSNLVSWNDFVPRIIPALEKINELTTFMEAHFKLEQPDQPSFKMFSQETWKHFIAKGKRAAEVRHECS
jgi:hypothetical protein